MPDAAIIIICLLLIVLVLVGFTAFMMWSVYTSNAPADDEGCATWRAKE